MKKKTILLLVWLSIFFNSGCASTQNRHPQSSDLNIILQTDFSSPNWLDSMKPFFQGNTPTGLDKTSRVYDQDRKKTVLQVNYPANDFDDHSGVDISASLGNFNHLILSYDVKFAVGFNFVKGGKLPALSGGADLHQENAPTAESGDTPPPDTPDGSNFWRAHLMWRKQDGANGRICQYVYDMHMTMFVPYGDKFDWTWNPAQNSNLTSDQFDALPASVRAHFIPGRWQNVKTEVQINDIGKQNGIIRSWLDGVLVFEKTDFEFRTTPTLAIQRFDFLTFFGGGDPSWAPPTAQTSYFDNILITQN